MEADRDFLNDAYFSLWEGAKREIIDSKNKDSRVLYQRLGNKDTVMR